MSRQIDEPDQPSTLPHPELNPLLNPLLAKNMGRWAEVYFTSAPDKREQAVVDLLRELEAENANGPADAPRGIPPTIEQQSSEAAFSPTAIFSPTAPPLLTKVACRSCGHENPENQRFCGMCGVALDGSALPPEPSFPITEIREPAFAPSARAQQNEERQLRSFDPAPAREEHSDDSDPYARYRAYSGTSSLFAEPESSFSYPYRVFIGLALALLIGALGYMAFRSGQSVSNLSQSAPVPTASTQNPPAADQPESKGEKTKSENPERTPQNDIRSSAPATKTSAPAETADAARSAEENPQTPVARLRPTRAESTQTEKEPARPADGGIEELALAQRYLGTEAGQKRDPSQAAEWLWKAVAKQNTEATVLLSDLYLRGDGIQKSCDQARVLLDAAARKGRKDASERLRHMQAFGCQ